METYGETIELNSMRGRENSIHERQTLWRNRGWNAFQSNRNNVTLALSLSSWLINRPCQRNHANCAVPSWFRVSWNYVARDTSFLRQTIPFHSSFIPTAREKRDLEHSIFSDFIKRMDRWIKIFSRKKVKFESKIFCSKALLSHYTSYKSVK